MAEETTTPELADVLANMGQVLNDISTRLVALETRKSGSNGPRKSPTSDAIAAAPEAQRTILENPDPELASLEQAITRTSKVRMIKRAAAHSVEAVQTYICAGGKAARALIAGEGPAIDTLTPMGLVTGSATHAYASAWVKRLQGIDAPTPHASKRSKRVRGNTASQATKRASAGGKL